MNTNTIWANVVFSPSDVGQSITMPFGAAVAEERVMVTRLPALRSALHSRVRLTPLAMRISLAPLMLNVFPAGMVMLLVIVNTPGAVSVTPVAASLANEAIVYWLMLTGAVYSAAIIAAGAAAMMAAKKYAWLDVIFISGLIHRI